ncbi:MAG: hypothetical protein ABH863_04810 [Candidatus Micrarchaeota archaeon]
MAKSAFISIGDFTFKILRVIFNIMFLGTPLVLLPDEAEGVRGRDCWG